MPIAKWGWYCTGASDCGFPVILHTGPELFRFETPQSKMPNLPNPLLAALPSLHVYPIDLAKYTMEQILISKNLDQVSKVCLSILKLIQKEDKDIITIRYILKERWPKVSEIRQRRYINAAINYIKFKSNLTADEFKELSLDMIRVHSINPNSPLAHEMREECRILERAKVEIIHGLLANDVKWPIIQNAVGISQAEWPALQERVKALQSS